MRQIIPGSSVWAVVFANGPPGAFAKIRPPALPVLKALRRCLQTQCFFGHAYLRIEEWTIIRGCKKRAAFEDRPGGKNGSPQITRSPEYRPDQGVSRRLKGRRSPVIARISYTG